MLLVLCFALLAALFALPFFPGIREVVRKEDAAPLFINMSYCKDPRYFALSFRKLMFKAIGNLPAGLHAITLSKKETVQIFDDMLNVAGPSPDGVLYLRSDLESWDNMTFKKEIYSAGNVIIGKSNQLQALACDGDVHVGKGTRFTRWLDAEGNAKIDEECSLGISATSRGELSLARGCGFTRLFGYPILTESSLNNAPDRAYPSDDSPAVLTAADIPGQQLMPTQREISEMPPNSRKNCNIISEGSLTIGDNSAIRGDIKSHGKLITGMSVTIAGNVFAEGDIEIGEGSCVHGSVFSQGCIRIKSGSLIGTNGKIKSIVGKKGVVLESGVRMYGYIVTEGKGVVA